MAGRAVWRPARGRAVWQAIARGVGRCCGVGYWFVRVGPGVGPLAAAEQLRQVEMLDGQIISDTAAGPVAGWPRPAEGGAR